MKKRRIMWTRMSGFLAATVLLSFCLSRLAAAQQATPTISVTVNKSMVFRLAERAKRSLRYRNPVLRTWWSLPRANF